VLARKPPRVISCEADAVQRAFLAALITSKLESVKILLRLSGAYRALTFEGTCGYVMSDSGTKILMTLAVLAAVAVGSGIGFAWMGYYGLLADPLNDKLAEMAQELNQTAPKMVDNNTRLDKVTVSKKNFTYHYTLIGVTKTNFNSLRPKLKSGFAKRLCAIGGWKKGFLDKGVLVEYSYSGSDGKPFGKVVVSRQDCK
jgi:hypothetical protein